MINGHTAPIGNVGEQTLAYQCIADRLPPFVQNYVFLENRKFELDFAWIDYRVGCEIQGGVFIKGAHGSITGILRDMTKRNLLIFAGWRVLQYTPDQVKNGEAIQGIKQLLYRKNP